ncbi:MAG: haloacid dehalogenase-like hydrolase [Lachnospiraceae bacterium]|nr:haloacid dehalogenase-like hydrolase [Lachnospiraceae bacterium]
MGKDTKKEPERAKGLPSIFGIGVLLQLLLLSGGMVLSLAGIMRSAGIRRIFVYAGQGGLSLALIFYGFLGFKRQDRKGLSLLLHIYAGIEGLRAALLSSNGVGEMTTVIARFILVLLAGSCLILGECLEKKSSEKAAVNLVILETLLYVVYLVGYPGMMYGHLTRFLPLAGVFIAGSLALFVRAKNAQLGAEEKDEDKAGRKMVIFVGAAVVTALCVLLAAGIRHDRQTGEKLDVGKAAEVLVVRDELSLWNDGAPAKQALKEYMDTIIDPDSPEYIAPADRIAVFDLDGTLFCETDPNYFDYTLLVHRVLEDKDYIDKASDFEKETAQKIVELNETGKAAPGLEVDHGKAVASAFSGMTIEEFNSYIQEFKKLPMPGYTGMKRGEGFYKPMLEIVDYLQENEFTVYIVSGTDRFIVRGILDHSELELPEAQIIGSDERVIARDQGDADGLEYVYDDDDELVLAGEFLIKNLKMNKVSVIAQEIGQQPVLSFGNSTGDSSMAEYVTSNNPHKSLAFMLCCDDTERENGNVEKADKMKGLCEEFDWIPISMKDDWKTIYGDGVTRIK